MVSSFYTSISQAVNIATINKSSTFSLFSGKLGEKTQDMILSDTSDFPMRNLITSRLSEVLGAKSP